jgi:small multidrug resistance pump
VKKWLFLGGAIVSEVTGSLSLKAALDHPAWYALMGAGFAGAFVFLSLVLRAGLPRSVSRMASGERSAWPSPPCSRRCCSASR